MDRVGDRKEDHRKGPGAQLIARGDGNGRGDRRHQIGLGTCKTCQHLRDERRIEVHIGLVEADLVGRKAFFREAFFEAGNSFIECRMWPPAGDGDAFGLRRRRGNNDQ